MSITTDILAYIPQRTPFVMVDALEQCDDNGAVSTFTVQPENIFVRMGNLTEPALIENIAQTAAARIGYIYNVQNKPVPLGFIGAVDKLKITDFPKVGETIYTTITIKHQILNATIIEGKSIANGKEVASCEMKIFVGA